MDRGYINMIRQSADGSVGIAAGRVGKPRRIRNDCFCGLFSRSLLFRSVYGSKALVLYSSRNQYDFSGVDASGVMKKKRWLLFGRHCGNEYYGEFATKEEAHACAIDKIREGYDAYLLDQKTGKQYGLRLKCLGSYCERGDI